ncbi:hypothetical protein XENORESO_013610 [Xenotaenia resolanae]|uniref:Uncharacterized protein n=1 Tax=Xenotaenia resolanae TaxID=208358 RepID=A0ABV0WFI9_9TELE
MDTSCLVKIIKLVRAKQGGGTRKIQMATDAELKDIFHEGKKLFFMMACPLRVLRLILSLRFGTFKQNHLTDDTCLTNGNMYEAARLTMLRFYIATKPKVPEEDDSETSEVIFVLESSSSEINPLQTGEVRNSSVDAHPGLEPSDDSEITFGPILNAEEDTEDTLIYEFSCAPQSN